MSRTQTIISGTIYGLWGALGAYRGHQFYMEPKQSKKEPKYYLSNNIFYAFGGTCFYLIPFTLFITAPLEINNLEDYIRGRK